MSVPPSLLGVGICNPESQGGRWADELDVRVILQIPPEYWVHAQGVRVSFSGA